MGSINYGSNNIFNIGLDTYKADKIINDFKEIYEEDYTEEEYLQFYAEDYLYTTKEILSNYDFNYYDIEIKYGYYDGFYLDIELNCWYFDNYKEKLEALKELTQLKKLILELLKIGLVNYDPGWCTSVYDLESNKNYVLNKLNAAIKKEKEAIKKMYTDKTLSYKDNFKKLLSM